MSDLSISEGMTATLLGLCSLDDDGPKLSETHVFVMHPALFFDFVCEMEEDDTGLWEDTSHEGAVEFGARVCGKFSGTTVLESANAPIFKVHFLARRDIEAYVNEGRPF